MDEQSIKDVIRSKMKKVPDFPSEGILFYDFFSIFYDPIVTDLMIDLLTSKVDVDKLDYVVGVESRGFLLGLLLASNLRKGFVPIRKAGKLPPPVIKSPEFKLEYATASLEMSDTIKEGDTVVLVDDVLATGNTLKAAYDMLEGAGANVQNVLCAIELVALKGAEKLEGAPLYTIFKDTEL
ncbi:MAG: adenine phosphoribosyltransferase [Bifidobacteriaceae bacterium]|nr:adenine phosphoribosyltransferase [Bifidobacteriaceae bacterium]